MTSPSENLLVGGPALEFLAARAGDQERSRSTYWNNQVDGFSVAADGSIAGDTVLGSVSRKTGVLHTIVHWGLQWPFRIMGRRLPSFKDRQRLGRLIARRQGRQFTHDMLRQVLSLALIEHHAPLDDDTKCNLVIGDGYGVMASLLLLARPGRKTILVNLTKPLLIDLAFIRLAVPDLGFALVRDRTSMAVALGNPDIRLIAVQADEAAIIDQAPLGMAVNVVSMQEMEMPVIAGYFRILRNNKSRDVVFYCANKLWKRLDDDTEVRFLDYPWEKEDIILHDSVCPWSQWVYSKTPPFWHYRRGKDRVIWHRLARLKPGQQP